MAAKKKAASKKKATSKKKAASKSSPPKIGVLTKLKEIQKELGEDVAVLGPVWDNTERATTGCFPFDYASAQGFPQGRISVVWGHDSSGKTTLCLMAIAQFQKTNPDKVCVLVDVEGHYDPQHGRMCGVDNAKLVYAVPSYAEQTVDIAEKFLYADDLGVMVIDSLGAMITANELDSSADKAVVGGASTPITKLYRKSSRALNMHRRKGSKPTLIAISQVTTKIGVMFGNPEVMKGGKSFAFGSSLTVYMTGKSEKDTKLHPDMDVWRVCSFKITKQKVPILAQNGEFKMAIADTKVFEKGYINDWPQIKERLEAQGHMEKGKGVWFCCDYEFRTQNDIREQLKSDPEFYKIVIDQIMATAMADMVMETDDSYSTPEEIPEEVLNTDELPFDPSQIIDEETGEVTHKVDAETGEMIPVSTGDDPK